jgi:hypothetical protein
MTQCKSYETAVKNDFQGGLNKMPRAYSRILSEELGNPNACSTGTLEWNADDHPSLKRKLRVDKLELNNDLANHDIPVRHVDYLKATKFYPFNEKKDEKVLKQMRELIPSMSQSLWIDALPQGFGKNKMFSMSARCATNTKNFVSLNAMEDLYTCLSVDPSKRDGKCAKDIPLTSAGNISKGGLSGENGYYGMRIKNDVYESYPQRWRPMDKKFLMENLGPTIELLDKKERRL